MPLLHVLISLYVWALIINAVLSWIASSGYDGPFVQIRSFFYRITAPVLDPLRRVIPRTSFGGVTVDFSVWIAILLLDLINRYI